HKDIERSPCHFPALYFVIEIRLIYQPAASAVDYSHPCLHLRHSIFVDQILCLRRERGVYCDEIGASVEIIERNRFDIHFGCVIACQVRVKPDYTHAEADSTRGDNSAYTSKTYDAEHLVLQFDTAELLLLPLPCLH